MTAPFAMSVPDAVAHLGISREVIYDAINKQQLPARRIGAKGTRWSIETADLEAWYRSLSRGPREDGAA